MLALKDIKGQDNAVRFLSNILIKERFSGSYLFTGPSGVGRALTAKVFILSMICSSRAADGTPCFECGDCRLMMKMDHPDVHWISPAKNESIRINEIRQVRDAMNLKPFQAGLNACIVENAHSMTVEAQNAFLKILEEPPGRSVIILITSKKDLLLPTVVSRCSEIRFSYLPVDVTADIIAKASSLNDKEAGLMAYFSQGSPGRALEMAEEGVLERREHILSLLDGFLKDSTPYFLNWDADDKDTLLEDIEMLIILVGDILLSKEGKKKGISKGAGAGIYGHFSEYTADRLHGTVTELVRLKKALYGNANPKIVAQVLPGILLG